MISVSGKKWIENKVNKNSIEKIKQDFQFSEIISRLIVSRNFDIHEIHSIKNEIEITNEFKNDYDFDLATDILIKSIKEKDLICIFGDYDVDGTASTSLLVRFFDYIKQPYFFYIPDRERDGYGPSRELFKKLILKKPKLTIMVDCGSSSHESINFLNDNNIKSIIIDHHDINKPYPKSNVIINPKKNDNNILNNYFCATTLTYFFLDILINKIESSYKISNFLIYVLLAIVCDVMPLRKINRIIALDQIKKFNLNDNIAFRSLYKLSDKTNKLSIDDLGYFIGPIINSGGRLSNSVLGTLLLSSNDPKIVESKSIKLIELNNKRKKIESSILSDVNFEKIQKDNKDVIIYYNPSINEGLIGIIAARLKDYFNKPSIVITNSKKFLKGSARSTYNYNMGKVIKKLVDNKLIEKGGGHNMAAGFTVKKNQINKMESFILKDFSLKNQETELVNKYDQEISSSAVNASFVREINKIGPFGTSNPLPTFLIKNLKVIKTNILNDKHISVIFKPNSGRSIKSICFNSLNTKIGYYLLSYKENMNVIGQIHENIWNNKKSLQLNIKDVLIKLN